MSPNRTRTKGRRGQRRVHPLVISAVTILLTTAVVVYAFNQGLPFVHKYTVYALVRNSVNVRTDDPVRIAGIDVGQVQNVVPAGEASKVSFTVEQEGLPIHRDATLTIRDRLFLEGSYYLELDPGSPGAPIAPEGFTIPLSNTSSPVQFYNVLSMFNTATRSSLTRVLATLNQGLGPQPGLPRSDSGAGGLKQTIPQLTPVLKDVSWVSQSLQGTHPGDLETLLSSTADVTSTLAGSSSQLTGLVRDLNITSGALASTDGSLAQTISGVDDTLRVAPASLVAIDRSLPPVVALSTALDPSLKASPPIIHSVIGTVGQLEQVVTPAGRARLIRTLDTTFVEFPSNLTELATAFPPAKPVTDCLRTHVTPILKATVPDGGLSSGRPVWQDFVHFLPGVAGASGAFDANGPYTRVLAGAGTNSLSGGAASSLGGLSPPSSVAGLLGSTPLLGQLVGTSPPGGGSLAGASPAWIGTLTPSVFRPDESCASQRVPSLATPAAAPDFSARHTAVAPPVTKQEFQAMSSSASQGRP